MKKVIIIGGGIAGLSAGVYAAQCGFETTILEMHSIAGGNCTSWKRGGYLFEGGMHWLTGSSSNQPLNKLWRNVGALDDNTKITAPETFTEYDHEGTIIKLYRNADKLEAHLLDLSPEDEKIIKRMCKDIRAFKKLSMPLTNIKGVKTTKKGPSPLAMLSMLPALPRMSAVSKFSCREYAEQFAHPGIRNAMKSAIIEDYYASALIVTLSSMSAGDGGFPEGGSLPFVARMVKRYESLGGKISYNTRAKRVLVENGAACGVITDSDEKLDADAVIVTLDTMAVDKLFDIPLTASWLNEMRRDTIPQANTFVSVGVNADLSDLPHMFGWKLEAPIECGGIKHEFMGISNYAGNADFSPEGKTALTIPLCGDSYDFWKRASEEGRYEEEKEKLKESILAELIKKIPRIDGKVEVFDVATPLTYERYCGSWHGSYMTIVPKNTMMKSYPCQVDNVSGCYFAGQRLTPPGGLPVAVMSGRAAVQHLCRDTDTVFVSEE